MGMAATEALRQKWHDFQVLLEQGRKLGVELEKKPVLLENENGNFRCRIFTNAYDRSKLSLHGTWEIEKPTYEFLGHAFEGVAQILELPIQVDYSASDRTETEEVLEHLQVHGSELDIYAEVVCAASKDSQTRFYAGHRGGEQSHKKMVEEALPALKKLDEMRFSAIYEVPIDVWNDVYPHLLPIKYITYAFAGKVGDCIVRWDSKRHTTGENELYAQFVDFPDRHLPQLLDEIDRIDKAGKEFLKN
jgi:hypothetical protein